MKPRALIVGKHGQVATALADALPKAGFDCTSIGRPECDLINPQSAVDAIARANPSIVINPAAYTAVDRAEDESELAYMINEKAAGAVALAAAAAGVPVIHVSTDYVFDGSKQSPYLETDATAPLGVYGASKLAGEIAVAAANPQHVILRTAWVCSPHGANFAKTMLRLAAERPELRVVDDQYGAPTFAADIAAAIAVIATKLTSSEVRPSDYGVFHYASAGETTWCRFARSIMEQSALRGGPHVPVTAIATREFPTKVRRPAYSKLSTDKIAEIYGLSAPDWHESLKVCLDQLVRPRLHHP